MRDAGREGTGVIHLRWSTRLFVLALLAGFGLRIAAVLLPDHFLNSDHAVVYLMARHAAAGELSAFFWGQGYGGSLLPWTAGLLMKGEGLSMQVLAVVGIGFWLLAAVMFRQLVRTGAEPLVADLAGVLFWFPGWPILNMSVAEGGFYGPSLAVGFGAMWLAARFPERHSAARWAGLGAMAGLALWLSPMAFAMSVPAVGYAVTRDWYWPRQLLGAACALPGIALWTWGTVTQHSETYTRLSDIEPMNLVHLVTKVFPAAFQGGRTVQWSWLMGLALVLSVAVLTRRAVRERNRAAGVLAAGTVMVALVLGLGTGSIPLDAHSMRYACFLFPAVVLAFALWVGTLTRPALRNFAALAVSAVAVAATSAFVFVLQAAAVPASPPAFSPDVTPAVRLLQGREVRAAYGSYWAAYALTASTNERITVAALAPRRYAPYEAAAARRPRTVAIVFADGPNDQILQTLRGRGLIPSFERAIAGSLAVYFFEGRTDLPSASVAAALPFGAH
jgi:hypothetical protein